MSDPSSHSRNQVVDALRLVAIALVVLTHVLNLRPEFRGLAPRVVAAIVAFNMPLFMAVSGYGAGRWSGQRPLAFVGRKALALLVPYAAWVALLLPIRRVPPVEWPARFARLAIDPGVAFQMWFLPVLFFAFALFALLKVALRTDVAIVTAAIAISVAAEELASQSLLFDKLGWLFPFLVLGYFAEKYSARVRQYASFAAAASVVVYPLLLLVPAEGLAYRDALALAGVGAAYAVVVALPRSLAAFFAFAGRRTMGMYGWQAVILPAFVIGTGWVGAIVSWISATTASLLLTLLLEHYRLTRAVLLGRWEGSRLRTWGLSLLDSLARARL